MSKRKGLSVDEKRKRMMDFFYEKKDFYQLKELEKQCQKEKGITSMSVKDILTSLVDDAMVDSEKIGTSIYFWAFPSKASQNRKKKIEELQVRARDLEKRRAQTESAIKAARAGKEDNAERKELMENLASAEENFKTLKAEMIKHQDCDPEVMAQRQQEVGVAKEAANRWTDNIFSTKSWIKNKFYFEDSVIDKQFGIPDDLDYID